jgi:hypothetical protein
MKMDFVNRNPGAVLDMEVVDNMLKDVREIRDMGMDTLNYDDEYETKDLKKCVILKS